jgi:hypothetical protein
LLGATALLGIVAPANAAPVQASPGAHAVTPSVVTHKMAGDMASRERAIMAYWTPQRMQQALRNGTPKVKASALPKATLAPATGGPKILARPTSARGAGARGVSVNAVHPAALATTPTEGKIFFTDPTDGNNYTCSGSSINNPAQDMVITAAHCVFFNNAYMTNWVYFPAYYNGPSAFYGEWFETDMAVAPQWIDGSNLAYDTAVVNVGNGSGATLVGTAGGNGITWDQPFAQFNTILGYPGNLTIPVYCQLTTFQAGPTEVGAACALDNGASGGPWIIDYNTTYGDGYVDGNTSIGIGNDSYSPYYGAQVDALYFENYLQ